MEIKFKFLADQVLLTQYNWNMSIPECKEILSFALIERLTHLLNAVLFVLDEVILEVAVA